MINKHKKYGVALIWSVVTCTVLLLIATIIVSATIKESQMSVRIDSSVRAYGAASSGIEWGKYCLQTELEKNAGNTVPPDKAAACMSPAANGFEFILNQAGVIQEKLSYSVKITTNGPTGYKITSLGKAGDTNRLLVFDYEGAQATQIDFPLTGNLTEKTTGTGSFTLAYDYWAPVGGTYQFGVANTAGTTSIYVETRGNEMWLVARQNGVEVAKSSTIILSSRTSEYAMQVKIKYTKDLGASLTVRNRFTGGEMDAGLDFCSFNRSVNLAISGNLDINKFYYSPSPLGLASSDIGDGGVISYPGGGAFLDNIRISNYNYP